MQTRVDAISKCACAVRHFNRLAIFREISRNDGEFPEKQRERRMKTRNKCTLQKIMSGDVLEEKAHGTVDESTTGKPPWYSEAKYERYWNHYNQMKEWMQGQQSLQLQDSLTNAWMLSYQQYFHQYQWWIYQNSLTSVSSPHHHHHHPYYPHPPSPWNSHYPPRTHHHHPHQDGFHHHHHHPYKPHPETTSYRGNKQYITDQSDVDYLDNGFSETPLEDDDEDWGGGGEEEEFEVELSEEMRQFFLQSQKHREELKELRQALNEKQNPEKTFDGDGVKEDKREDEIYDDEFEMNCTSSKKKSKRKHIIGAPVEQPGRRRAEEMKILYGKNSPAIHGMETAIQMQFDRNCDKKQPSFWPTVPLKM